jgi:N-acyl homoserine lactone hydrolase
LPISTATPQRLYLMKVAALPPPTNTPAVCYLIQTSDGKNILVDSGIPDPDQLPPDMPSPVVGANVIDQLAQIGLQPTEIDLLICTHFDLDHAGQHTHFTQAEFIVQRTHYEVARQHPRFARTRPQWDQPTIHYRLVEGDVTLLPGLELIATSGHVPGHQSILVRLPETGPVLLTIDAVPDQASFTLDRQPSPRDMDVAGTRATTRKLLDLVAREQVVLVIFGHDGEQWQRLKLAPNFYR